MGKRRGKKSEPAAGDGDTKKRKKKHDADRAPSDAADAAPRGPSLKKTKGDRAEPKSKRATHGAAEMRYGVLKGRAVKGKRAHKHAPHYELVVKVERDGGEGFGSWRVPIDVRATAGSQVLFFADGDVTAQAPDRAALAQRWAKKLEALAALGSGWTDVAEAPTAIALDYAQEAYAHPDEMTRGGEGESANDDIQDEVHLWVKRAIAQRAEVLVFGSRFDEKKTHGVHDVHQNQGNDGERRRENGAHRDGGLLLRFPSGKTAALLFAFAMQTRDVDDAGNPR